MRLRLALCFIALASSSVVAAETLPVLDLCALRPDADADRSVRQRLLLFSVANTQAAEGDEPIFGPDGNATGSSARWLERAGAQKHINQVFLQTFVMRRFHNVLSPDPAPEDWFATDTLSAAAVRRHLASDPRYGRFLAYSSDCVDFLALPRLDRLTATWHQTKVKRQKGKKIIIETAWKLKVVPHLSVTLFERRGPHFVRTRRVQVSGGGMLDLATDEGAATMQAAQPGLSQLAKKIPGQAQLKRMLKRMLKRAKGHRDTAKRLNARIEAIAAQIQQATQLGEPTDGAATLAKTLGTLNRRVDQLLRLADALEAGIDLDAQAFAHALATAQSLGWRALISGLPGPRCAVPKRGVDGTEAGFQCQAPSHLPPRQVGLAGLSERSGPYCKGLKLAKRRHRPRVAVCELRTRMENITLLAQKESRKTDGWRLWAPIQYTDDDEPAISLGDDEGVRRGDIFIAREGKEGDWDDVGWAKITETGPGAEAGLDAPSTMRFRSGHDRAGLRMEEHPQIGVSLAYGAFGSALLDPIKAKDDQRFMAGSTLEVGFNMSHLVSLGHEYWLRTHAEHMYWPIAKLQTAEGGGVDTHLHVITAFSGFESKVHLRARVDLFMGIAGGYTTVVAVAQEGSQKSNAGGDSTVAIARGMAMRGSVGLDLLLSPDWYLRAEAAWRQHFSEFELDNDTTPVPFDGTKIGHLNGLNAHLTLGVIL